MANMDEEKVTYFAETDSRGKKTKFGIKQKDRTKHVYVIGKTGMGKSTLLENMAVQDILDGHGMCFIDPHGKTAELLLEYVPEHRVKDVLYFAPFDLDHPISFNVLEKVEASKRHLVVSGLMSTFKKIWADAWSARMEYILTYTLLALLEYPDATLLSVNRMLSDKIYRQKVVDAVTDPAVKAFWVEEFAKYTDRFAAEATPAIQNKIGQFTSNALIRNMIGQPKSSFDLRKMMDERKIVIVNLSKGRVGEQNANLLGGLLITKIYLAAMSRADIPERELKKLPNFYLFVDEFQSFANKSFADILSEARKYKLNLTIAHQYIEQMEEEVRDAVFGNVGTMILFRVGAFDAEIFEKEFAPIFTSEDIVNLGFTQIYLKLMIDGVSSQPFSATTLPPIKQADRNFVEEVRASSRAQFAHDRILVEQVINDWHKPIVPEPKQKDTINNKAKEIKDKEIKERDNKKKENEKQNNSEQIKYHNDKHFNDVNRKNHDDHAKEKTVISLTELLPKRENSSNSVISNTPQSVKKIIEKEQHNKKEPNEKNVSDLKKALESALKLRKGSDPAFSHESGMHKNHENNDHGELNGNNGNDNTVNNSNNKNGGRTEISENELKKVLYPEEDKKKE